MDLKHIDNRRFFLLLIFVLIISISYGFFEFTKTKSESFIGQANAGIAKCGCSKCHTITLHGCDGCHNSPNDKKLPNDSNPGSKHTPESDIPNKEIDESTPKTDEPTPLKDQPLSSETGQSNEKPQGESGNVPSKSKLQQGPGKSN